MGKLAGIIKSKLNRVGQDRLSKLAKQATFQTIMQARVIMHKEWSEQSDAADMEENMIQTVMELNMQDLETCEADIKETLDVLKSISPKWEEIETISVEGCGIFKATALEQETDSGGFSKGIRLLKSLMQIKHIGICSDVVSFREDFVQCHLAAKEAISKLSKSPQANYLNLHANLKSAEALLAKSMSEYVAAGRTALAPLLNEGLAAINGIGIELVAADEAKESAETLYAKTKGAAAKELFYKLQELTQKSAAWLYVPTQLKMDGATWAKEWDPQHIFRRLEVHQMVFACLQSLSGKMKDEVDRATKVQKQEKALDDSTMKLPPHVAALLGTAGFIVKATHIEQDPQSVANEKQK